MAGGAWNGGSGHRGHLSKSAEKVMIFEKIPYPIFALVTGEKRDMEFCSQSFEIQRFYDGGYSVKNTEATVSR